MGIDLLWDGFVPFAHMVTLPCETTFINLEVDTLRDAEISWHHVPNSNAHEVTWHLGMPIDREGGGGAS